MAESNIEDVQPQPTQQPEAEFTFVVKVSEANLILAGLEELPHKISRRLIDNLVQQAQSQTRQ